MRDANIVIAIDINNTVVAKAIPWLEYQHQQKQLHIEKALHEVLLAVKESKKLKTHIDDYRVILRPSVSQEVEYNQQLTVANEVINKLANMMRKHIYFLGVEKFNRTYGCSGLTILDIYLKELVDMPEVINVDFVVNLISEGACLKLHNDVLPEYCTELAKNLYNNSALYEPLIIALRDVNLVVVIGDDRSETEAISLQEYKHRQKRLLDARKFAEEDGSTQPDMITHSSVEVVDSNLLQKGFLPNTNGVAAIVSSPVADRIAQSSRSRKSCKRRPRF